MLYSAWSRLLWLLGLRAADPEPLSGGCRSGGLPVPARRLAPVYTEHDLHFTNWNLLKRRSHYSEAPPREPGASAVCLSWLYTGCIAALLCARPAVFTYRVAARGDPVTEEDVAFLCFLWLIPVQYVHALIYLSTDHIEPHLCYTMYGEDSAPFSSSSSSSVEALALDPDLVERVRWRPPRLRRAERCLGALCLAGLLAALAAGIGLSASSTALLRESRVPLAGTRAEWLGRLLGVIDTVYGRTTQALNLAMFAVVFHNHWRDLCFIERCIADYLFRTVGTSTLIHHIILVRHSVDVSVRKFHAMFSSFTLVGAIAVAALLHYCTRHPARTVPLYLAVCSIAYLAVQALYLVLVHRIAHQRGRLLELLHQPRMTLCCLNRLEGLGMHCEPDGTVHYPFGETHEQNTKHLVIIAAESASTVDWQLLQSVLERRWEEFEVLGVRVSDGSLLMRCVGLVGLLLSGKYLL